MESARCGWPGRQLLADSRWPSETCGPDTRGTRNLMNTCVTVTPRLSSTGGGRACLPERCRVSHGPGHSPAPGSNRARSCSKGKLFTPTDSQRRNRQWLGWRPDAQSGSPSCPEPAHKVTEARRVRRSCHAGRGCTWGSLPPHPPPAPPCPTPSRDQEPPARIPQPHHPPPQHPQRLHLEVSPSPRAWPARTPALGACDPRALPAARPATNPTTFSDRAAPIPAPSWPPG